MATSTQARDTLLSVFTIRAALPGDLDAMLELASHLDSVNLPHDRTELQALLQRSEDSFAGAYPNNPGKRRFIFLLWDHENNAPAATSMVHAQLGTREAPYIYFAVLPEEKYSPTLDSHFHHRVLSIRYSFDGPTELGGLVVHPNYRKHPSHLGYLISMVRFLWIAARREQFQNQLLAELLPPLSGDGTSHLWEAVGKRFTHLTYREADRLSQHNKEFIRSLFPDGDIYASLLSQEAQQVIGQVGPKTKPVERMLTRMGFRYAERVDPFDGGPHYIAHTDKVTPIQQTVQVRLQDPPPNPDTTPPKEEQLGLIATITNEAPWFQATHGTYTHNPNTHTVSVTQPVMNTLKLGQKSNVFILGTSPQG